MIKKCSVDDIKQIVDMVYRKNNEPEHNSAFCFRQHDSIQQDFMSSLASDNDAVIGYYEGNTLIGVISFYVDEEKQTADCGGPFVEGDFCRIAKEMFDYAKKLYKKQLCFNFFFDKKNIECMSFMNLIGAENQGNESVFTLNRSDYKKQEFGVSVEKLSPEYATQLIELHDSIFPGMYVSGKDIVQSNGVNRKVFCIINNGCLIGYSVFKTPPYGGTTATAEIIAVDEKYRGKGYGRILLNAIVKEGFSHSGIDRVDLVVEDANQNAIELYSSFGFKLQVENCFYQVK